MPARALLLLLLLLPSSASADPETAGRVFGEPVPKEVFDSIRKLYGSNVGMEDEQVWRFIAFWKAGERAGVKVDDEKVQKEIVDSLKWTVAQHQTVQDLERRRVDLRSPEGKRMFQQLLMQRLLNKTQPTRQQLEAAVRYRYGASLAKYSEHQRREALVQAYLAQQRAEAVIPEAALRAEWLKRAGHTKVELYEVPTDRFAPRADAAPGTPGHVTPEDLAGYYPEWRRTFWATPRVTIEYLGVPFSSASRDEVAVIMDAVADAVDAHKKGEAPFDLKAIHAAVLPTLEKKVLVHGTVGPVGARGLKRVPLLDAFSARRWLRTCRVGSTSEVLGGPKGWFLLRAAAIRRAPSLAKATAEVKRAYLNVDAQTQKRRAARRALGWAEAVAVELEVATAKHRGAWVEQGAIKLIRAGVVARSARRFAEAPVPRNLSGARAKEVLLSESEAGDRLFLWRVVERVPQSDGFAAAKPSLTKTLRAEAAIGRLSTLLYRAKSISPALRSYAAAVRKGKRRLRLRRIYLPPDMKTLDDWLSAAATRRLAAAQAELAKGADWDEVRRRYSEDPDDLPDDRRTLSRDYGLQFALQVGALRQHATSKPLRSRVGLHLVRHVVGKGHWSYQQILIKIDAATRKPPPELIRKAWNISERRILAAEKELQAGGLFLAAAERYGGDYRNNARGQAFWVTTLSYFEQAALTQYLRYDPKGVTAGDVPPVVRVATPLGNHWHLFASGRDRVSPRGTGDSTTWHIRGKTKAAVEAVRATLVNWITNATKTEGRAPSWARTMIQFRELARKHSDAPSAAKGGAIGKIDPVPFEVEYGVPFLVQISRVEKLSPGLQTGVFRSEHGHHIVRVVDVEVPDAATQRRAVDEALLDGTGWD